MPDPSQPNICKFVYVTLRFDDDFPHDFSSGYNLPTENAVKGVTLLPETGTNLEILKDRGLYINSSQFELSPIENAIPAESWHIAIWYY